MINGKQMKIIIELASIFRSVGWRKQERSFIVNATSFLEK